MAGIDFGSQEFLLSALLSNDLEMIEAYMSGDPYLAFGKLRNVIPKDGTKATHKIEREMCKSSVLGISYAMTKYGLAIKMTADTGKVCTEDEAQEWINEFYNAFPDLAEYKKDIEDQYEDDRFLRLPCGWTLWGDNENPRSVGNFPIQGLGGTIMRKAVDIAVEKGVQVVKTLHDAIYIMYDIGDEQKILIIKRIND
jgi:DNA polymerase-1